MRSPSAIALHHWSAPSRLVSLHHSSAIGHCTAPLLSRACSHGLVGVAPIVPQLIKKGLAHEWSNPKKVSLTAQVCYEPGRTAPSGWQHLEHAARHDLALGPASIGTIISSLPVHVYLDGSAGSTLRWGSQAA